MLKRNSYVWTGLGLLVAGSLLSLTAYFVLSTVWLTALGISMLVLAFILLALGRTIPGLPPEVCRLLLETGIENTSAIVEELGIRSPAVYLPSSLAGGRPRAFIPLHSSPSLPVLTKPLPQRLIARYGAGPDDVGLLLSTVGSTAAGMLESKASPSAAGLEEALTQLFSGVLGVADAVTVTSNQQEIKVEIHKPRIESRATWSHSSLGGPLASIAASVAAEALDKPVAIKRDERAGGKHYVELEVLG